MYKDFFGLKESPFKNNFDLKFYYSGERNSKIKQEILEIIEDASVPLQVIIGERGVGKSTFGIELLQSLLEWDEYNASLLVATHKQTDFGAFLKGVIRQFNISGSKVEDVSTFIKKSYSTGKKKTVFLIDNGDNLSSEEVIAEIVCLADLKGEDGVRIVSVVLLALPLINEWLDKCEKLKKAVKQYRLGSFNLSDTEGYICHRLEICGGREEIFPKTVREKLYEFLADKKNRVVFPFWINILCDALFLETYLLKKKSVEVNLTESVLNRMSLQIIR